MKFELQDLTLPTPATSTYNWFLDQEGEQMVKVGAVWTKPGLSPKGSSEESLSDSSDPVSIYTPFGKILVFSPHVPPPPLERTTL